MAKGKTPKSWVEQLADLEDPAPRELDPEDDAGHFEEGDGSDSAGNDGDLAAARGHYTDVGKSKLRTADGFDLGPQYTGASITRDALVEAESEDDPFGSHSEQEESESGEYADPDEDLDEQQLDTDEEIDSGEAFETGDEEKFAKFSFGNGISKADGEVEGFGDGEDGGSEDDDDMDASDGGINGVDRAVAEEDSDSNDAEMDDDEPSDGDSDNTSLSNGLTAPKSDDRAALRKMMAEEAKTVAASLSKAAKTDITKGRAIKHQRTTFDSLLNTRIKLQKALIATNSMQSSAAGLHDHHKAIEAAERAALKLWDTLSELRSLLQPTTSKSLPTPTTTSATHSKSLWETMHDIETLNIPKRRANLTKWSQKTTPATALPRPGKFSQTPAQQPLTSILDQHLSGPNAEKLVQKTQTPRSCAPVQLSSRTPSDPSIYDDADFYTLLLRDLVDQRMADSTATTITSSLTTNGATSLPNHRSFKVKKPVDTKASKGRKMRYTVHEKLQNFMAPEDVGRWGERQRRELFGGLFGGGAGLGEDEGVRMEGGEGGGDGDEDDDEVRDGMEGGGLRLFG